MRFIFSTVSFAILVLIIIGIFPAASSSAIGHTRYLNCPYPTGTTMNTQEFSISITQVSSLPTCKLYNSCYAPAVLVVNCYSKVTWQNDDYNIHLISSGSQDGGTDGWFGSGLIHPGQGFSNVFYRPGIYSYYDPLHSWAQGTVVVLSGDNKTDSEWLKYVSGPKCTLGDPHCAHPNLR